MPLTVQTRARTTGSGGGGASGFSGWSGLDGVASNQGASGYSGFSSLSGLSGWSGIGTSGFSGILATPSLVQAGSSLDQAITNSFNDITFDTNRVTSGSDVSHDTVVNNARFTVNSTGLYAISFHLEPDNNLAFFEAKVVKNGSTTIPQSLSNTAGENPDQNFIVDLVQGDYVTLQAKDGVGDGKNWVAARTHFFIERIGAAKGDSGFSGHSGFSATGQSGFSGQIGSTGISGWSGTSSSGFSGYSGFSSNSGLSGYSGTAGSQGASGFSGFSSESGFSGGSGYSGSTGSQGASGFSGFSSVSGFSGFSSESGFSGASGYSGWSGQVGASGFSGFSGFSSPSGFSGNSGYSGTSGEMGASGFSGFSGFSAWSGMSGFSGHSGFSGTSGAVGSAGVSGFSGFSGFSGVLATPSLVQAGSSVDQTITNSFSDIVFDTNRVVSGTDVSHDTVVNNARFTVNSNGFYAISFHLEPDNNLALFEARVVKNGSTTIPQSLSNTAGENPDQNFIVDLVQGDYVTLQARDGVGDGKKWVAARTHFYVERIGAAKGESGFSGFSGTFSGYSGFSGTGLSGFSGFSGLGFSGPAGASGFSGFSSDSGLSGFSGTGFSGPAGASGFSGFSGIGTSGFSGLGFSGPAGASGFSGFSSDSGLSGFSGTGLSGPSGFSGSAGTSGFSGLGFSGPAGASGFSGFSGTTGTSGFSGTGFSGSAGASGFSGFSGTTGTSGFSGLGFSGPTGASGFSGPSGPSGFSGFSSAPGISGFSGTTGTGIVEREVTTVSENSTIDPPTSEKVGRISVLSFDPDVQNAIDFLFEAPEDLVPLEDVVLVLSYHAGDNSAGNVRLSLDYEIVDDGQDTTPASVTGTLVSTVSIPSSSFEIKQTATITIPGAAVTTVTDSIRFTLTRIADHVGDTYAGTFKLESLSLRYRGFGASSSSGFSGYSGFSSQSGISGFSAIVTSIAQRVTVAQGGADFTSIQDAIDSITDATISKQYVVDIYPGDYNEQIALKNFVHLAGHSNAASRGAVRVYHTNNVIKFANECTVRGLYLEVIPGGPSAVNVGWSDSTMGGTNVCEFRDCLFRADGNFGTQDIALIEHNATSGGLVRLTNCKFRLNNTSSGNTNYQRVIWNRSGRCRSEYCAVSTFLFNYTGTCTNPEIWRKELTGDDMVFYMYGEGIAIPVKFLVNTGAGRIAFAYINDFDFISNANLYTNTGAGSITTFEHTTELNLDGLATAPDLSFVEKARLYYDSVLNKVLISVSGAAYTDFSGLSGFSGFSAWSGTSGAAGANGTSGFSGFSAWSGTSGAIGDTGASGFSGFSAWSGTSGAAGANGTSGFSGFSAWSGTSGTAGANGTSGFSGFSAWSGTSGAAGANGTSGFSGFSAWSGTSGATGNTGTSGFSGFSAWSGTSGSIGTVGTSGFSGFSSVAESGAGTPPSYNLIMYQNFG